MLTIRGAVFEIWELEVFGGDPWERTGFVAHLSVIL